MEKRDGWDMSIFEFMHRVLPWSTLRNPFWIASMTTGLFGGMALFCVVYGWQSSQRAPVQREILQRFYYSQALLLIGLGLDRQMGLLNWLTSYSRLIAMRDGWYYTRRAFQLELILGCTIAGLLFLGITCWWFRTILHTHWLPLVGAVGLLTYVAIRAVSLHDVDALLATRVWGLRWDTLCEVGGSIFLFCTLTGVFVTQRKRAY